MNKLTDAEIIKALECCRTSCKECPLKKHGEDCASKLDEYALDLINRQKAEIERLQDIASKQQSLAI